MEGKNLLDHVTWNLHSLTLSCSKAQNTWITFGFHSQVVWFWRGVQLGGLEGIEAAHCLIYICIPLTSSILGNMICFEICVYHNSLPTCLVRTYPPRFGIRLIRLHRSFCSNRDLWEPSMNVESMHIKDLFNSLDWNDLWHDAGAMDILRFIRGNKYLQLDDEWRALFPSRL